MKQRTDAYLTRIVRRKLSGGEFSDTDIGLREFDSNCKVRFEGGVNSTLTVVELGTLSALPSLNTETCEGWYVGFTSIPRYLKTWRVKHQGTEGESKVHLSFFCFRTYLDSNSKDFRFSDVFGDRDDSWFSVDLKETIAFGCKDEILVLQDKSNKRETHVIQSRISVPQVRPQESLLHLTQQASIQELYPEEQKKSHKHARDKLAGMLLAEHAWLKRL